MCWITKARYTWVPYAQANFIVVGFGPPESGSVGRSYGIQATTTNEFEAYRIRKVINDMGGEVRVDPYAEDTSHSQVSSEIMDLLL